jgi:hypothetical protein
MSEKKLPDGWGRSVVGGKEILTPPSKRKVIESGIDDEGKPYQLTEDDMPRHDISIYDAVDRVMSEQDKEEYSHRLKQQALKWARQQSKYYEIEKKRESGN